MLGKAIDKFFLVTLNGGKSCKKLNGIAWKMISHIKNVNFNGKMVKI
jgi:hypothetical protein